MRFDPNVMRDLAMFMVSFTGDATLRDIEEIHELATNPDVRVTPDGELTDIDYFVRSNTPYFAQMATNLERSYYCRFPAQIFRHGKTARLVTDFIRSPKKHGLDQQSMVGQNAIYRLQTKMLCELVASPKTVTEDCVPDTLQFDVDHLETLRRQFFTLVAAQTFATLYEAVLRQRASAPSPDERNQIVRLALDQLSQNNANVEEITDVITSKVSDKELRAMLKQVIIHNLKPDNPVWILNARRMRDLIFDALQDPGQIDYDKIRRFSYEPMRYALEGIKKHLEYIETVHFEVSKDLFQYIMDTNLEIALWNTVFDDLVPWPQMQISDSLKEKAFEIRHEYENLIKTIGGKNAKREIVASIVLRKQLFETVSNISKLNWIEEQSRATILQRIDVLRNCMRELLNQWHQERRQIAEEEAKRVIPLHLKTGWIL
ncbi:hypothetical protein EHM76_01260 [bacterium]|nr:MAG: hypothetical protein EHM76_01260 [bacterium]